MIAGKVLNKSGLHKKLRDKGFTETPEKTKTGVFWKNAAGKVVQVPNSEDGMYPNWMLEDLEEQVGKLKPDYNE